VHEGKLSDTIAINTGVSQGCILAPIIFLMVIDDVMNIMILGKKKKLIGLSQTTSEFRLCR
jgi:hypothetical protein